MRASAPQIPRLTRRGGSAAEGSSVMGAKRHVHAARIESPARNFQEFQHIAHLQVAPPGGPGSLRLGA